MVATENNMGNEPSLVEEYPSNETNKPHWGNRLMMRTGDALSWLFPILMVAIVSQVLLRKAGINQAWLDDAQWWIYGVAVLTGFGYAVTTNSHVRVDIFYANFSTLKKTRIEIFGLGWLFLPFLILMADITLHYAIASWIAREGSDSPNGLHRLYILKCAIPILFTMAIIATYAKLHDNISKFYSLHKYNLILATFPAVWFFVERVTYYSLWWYVRINDPSIHPRRIAKEPILEDTMWFGLVIVVLIAAVSLWNNRTNSVEK